MAVVERERDQLLVAGHRALQIRTVAGLAQGQEPGQPGDDPPLRAAVAMTPWLWCLYFDPDKIVIFRMIFGSTSPTKKTWLVRWRPGNGKDFLIERHAMLAPRSFPRPWSVVEIPGGFRDDHANGKRLGYFYSWDDANAAHPLGDVLTADEARRMAEEFAKLPEP
jgi:hypothetical protein